jgi:hypothetical protein
MTLSAIFSVSQVSVIFPAWVHWFLWMVNQDIIQIAYAVASGEPIKKMV